MTHKLLLLLPFSSSSISTMIGTIRPQDPRKGDVKTSIATYQNSRKNPRAGPCFSSRYSGSLEILWLFLQLCLNCYSQFEVSWSPKVFGDLMAYLAHVSPEHLVKEFSIFIKPGDKM